VEVDPAKYCRQIEDYLCRKNDGHLIRIVGPAFEQVCGWATRGVPLKVAFGGIDRYFERYYAKGPRRRPVRVEFCEADVLDAFDQWRRAAGITLADAASDVPESEHGDEPERRHGSLPAHLDRIIARLTALRAGADRTLDDVLDGLVRELDGARGKARGLRGDAREAFLSRLQQLDVALVAAARERIDPAALAQCRADADAELAPFRQRLARGEYERAHAACVDRLVRERYRLPHIAFE
jgi:hypothetical protein